jgi:hypothetical protein
MQYSLSPEEHHSLAVQLNLMTWQLLEKGARSERENQSMEGYALGSLYHWTRSHKFQPCNAQRGHWLLARVYAVLEQGEKSMRHACHCMELTNEHALKGFDLFYSHEALARAHAASGNNEDASSLFHKAVELCGQIQGAQDRRIATADLNVEPWFGLSFGA